LHDRVPAGYGCDIFVPDVTIVARTEGGKSVPNPNVMYEYGYAWRAKTYVAMIPVMNTAFGLPQELVWMHLKADTRNRQGTAA